MIDDPEVQAALAAMAEQYRQDEERRTVEFRAQLARYRAEMSALVRDAERLRDALRANKAKVRGDGQEIAMNKLPATLRDLANRIEAHEVQNGQAFHIEAKPGVLTIHHSPDASRPLPAGHAGGWMEDGVWREGVSQVLDI